MGSLEVISIKEQENGQYTKNSIRNFMKVGERQILSDMGIWVGWGPMKKAVYRGHCPGRGFQRGDDVMGGSL